MKFPVLLLLLICSNRVIGQIPLGESINKGVTIICKIFKQRGFHLQAKEEWIRYDINRGKKANDLGIKISYQENFTVGISKNKNDSINAVYIDGKSIKLLNKISNFLKKKKWIKVEEPRTPIYYFHEEREAFEFKNALIEVIRDTSNNDWKIIFMAKVINA